MLQLGKECQGFLRIASLDADGNCTRFRQDDNGDGAWDLLQDRTSDRGIEITLSDKMTGDAWGSAAYGAAGNVVRRTNPQATGTDWKLPSSLISTSVQRFGVRRPRSQVFLQAPS